jgi:hypothetical protein
VAWKIKKGLDAIYSGAQVWWQDRDDCGQMGAGIIFGFIWDTPNNGVVLQFSQGNYYARYFIDFDLLVKSWNPDTQQFRIETAKLLVMADEFKSTERTANLPMTSCTRNNKAVPIWTYFY